MRGGRIAADYLKRKMVFYGDGRRVAATNKRPRKGEPTYA